MITCKNICFIAILTLLLSSCQEINKQDGNDDIMPTVFPVITHSIDLLEDSDEVDSTMSIVKRSVAFEIFYNYDFYPSSTFTIGFPLFNDSVNVEAFRRMVNEDEMEKWLYDYPYLGLERENSLRTDVRTFVNMYSFICDFDLSEYHVRKVLDDWNDDSEIHRDFEGERIFSDEEIDALATRNIQDILRLFAFAPPAIVKNDKFYAPGWFFHASTEDYGYADIVLEDVISIFDFCREGFVRDFPTIQYFYDVVEYNFYHYQGGDVDVIALCGYDRDFSMPLAYMGYHTNDRYNIYPYVAFFNTYTLDDYQFDVNLIKGEDIYTAHWVYYNKPDTYREAGITPDELIEMLPRYKALDIFTDDAWTALENKIYGYQSAY